VAAVFEERIRAALPEAAPRILHLVEETRGGRLYDSRFGVRGRGEGPYAAAIAALFRRTAARLGYLQAEGSTAHLGEAPTTFRRPPRHGQLELELG
jgi:hypothetical protein